MRWMACLVALALFGGPSVVQARPSPRPLVLAQTLSKAGLRKEIGATAELRSHNGRKAAAMIASAEKDLAGAAHAINRAPLDRVDEQSITAQLAAASRLDEQARASGPDNALVSLAAAVSHTRTALTMIVDVSADGGPIPG